MFSRKKSQKAQKPQKRPSEPGGGISAQGHVGGGVRDFAMTKNRFAMGSRLMVWAQLQFWTLRLLFKRVPVVFCADLRSSAEKSLPNQSNRSAGSFKKSGKVVA